MTEAASTCPKCGQPRPRAAVECPFCGVVYARFHARAEPAEPPPEDLLPDEALEKAAEVPVPPPRPSSGGLDDVYQGPSIEEVMAARQPAGPGALRQPGVAPRSGTVAQSGRMLRSGERPEEPVETETVFTRTLGPSIFIAAVVLLLLQAFVQSQVVGAGGDWQEANQILFSLAGIDAPEELADAAVFNWVGHRFVIFTEAKPSSGPFPTFLLLYRRGALAGGTSTGELAGVPRAKLELIEVPFHHFANRSLTLNRQPRVAEWLSLGDEKNPTGHFVSVAFEASDGEPALLVLAGPAQRVQQMLRSFQ